VAIDVKKASGYSTTDVSAKINARLAELRLELAKSHPGTRLEVVRDSGVRVEASVDDVKSSLIEGALLTILVVFVFLKSWRSTVITGLALPVSVIASFIAVLAFGFTLNVMSLLGLSLAIGILIDDAIVVRENIVRHMERGKDHVQAAKDGTSEIGLAVAATTFSIVVVFVPIAFMGGIAQQWFAPFALTIACSVLVSLFVSFSLDPMLSAVWADPEATGHKKSWLTRQLDYFDRAFVALTRFYKKVIRWALRHRLLMVVIMFFVLVGTAAIPGTGMVGCAFMPVEDRSEFTVQIETPPGSNLDYTRGKVAEAVALVRKHKEVAYTYATVGGQGGTVDSASIYVRLTPKHKRSVHQDVIAQRVRNEIRALSGVTAYISTGGFGPQKQVQIELTGEDTAVLTNLAEQVAARVATVPGAVDVGLSSKGQRPEVEVVLDRELAGALGVSVADVAQALRPAFTGLDVADWIDPTAHPRRGRAAGRGLAAAARGPRGAAGGADEPGRADHDPARADRHDQAQPGPGAGRAQGRRSGHHRRRQHRRPAAVGGDRRHRGQAGRPAAAAGLRAAAGRRGRRSAGGVHPHLHRARHRGPADVLHPGHPVRVVPRAAADHGVAAAVVDRRDAGDAGHRLDAQPDEHDRRDPPDGHRRQERDPVDRLRQAGRARGAVARGGADRGRRRAAATDHHDVGGDHRRHAADRDRLGRGRRLPGAAGARGDRRHDFVDGADAAGDPDLLRHPHPGPRSAAAVPAPHAAAGRGGRGAGGAVATAAPRRRPRLLHADGCV
jgi:hypothetical protein